MKHENESIEKWKQEILDTEQQFADLLKEEGMHKAFITFASEEAVLMRNNKLIVGKNNIDQFYKNQDSKNLEWKPDFVDVAESGDIGYTYGQYIFTSLDSSGKSKVSTGVFHTVWKRRSDGKWRFVLD